MPPSRSKLIYLESLRGLAALVVVLHHLKLTFFPSTAVINFNVISPRMFRDDSWVLFLSIFVSGGYAVRLFFLLSGFVLSISYFRKKDSSILTSAAVRRYPRLMLPVFGSVLFAWLIQDAHGYHNAEAALRMGQLPSSWLYQNYQTPISFLHSVSQGLIGVFFHYDWHTTLNSSLWTMPIELAGSFFIFSFLALMGSVQKRLLVYLIAAFVLQRMGSIYMIDFLAGLILCDFYVRWEDSKSRREMSWPLSVLMIIAGFFLGSFASAGWLGIAPFYLSKLVYVPTVASLLIVGAAVFSSPIQNVLEHAGVSFFGRLSFPLYLLHIPLLCSVGCWSYLGLRSDGLSHIGASTSASLITLAICILAAWAGFYILERPAILIGSWLSNFFHLPKPIALSAQVVEEETPAVSSDAP